MMLMRGHNQLILNHATLNAILTQWYNTHAHMEEGKEVELTFVRAQERDIVISIKDKDVEL